MKTSDLPQYYNVSQILEHNLAERGQKVALYSTERSITFQEAAEEANQVGNALKKADVRFGDCVGILAPDSAEWVTSFFGITKIGAVALGMNTLLKPQDYDYILRDSRVRVIIAHESLLDSIESVRDNHPTLKQVVVIGQPQRAEDVSFETWISGESITLETEPTHRNGSTQRHVPRAQRLSPHRAKFWRRSLWPPRVRLYFLGRQTLLCLWHRREPRLPLVCRSQRRILWWLTSPSGWRLKDSRRVPADYLCLRTHRPRNPRHHRLYRELPHLSRQPPRRYSPRQQRQTFEAKIVDDDGQAVAQGEIGHLMVKGESMALFYLHQYDKSRRTFRGEWLFTGDRYYMDVDGFYWHAGRGDDMLKIGGLWVSPIEIENVISEHPAVLECAVIGHRDQAELVKPKVFITLNEGYTRTDELLKELLQACTKGLETHKRPRWFEFVDALPRTATGKVQRFKLYES